VAETKLLFVDDEPDLLAFYRQVFERDFTVTVFSRAQAALEHLVETPDTPSSYRTSACQAWTASNFCLPRAS